MVKLLLIVIFLGILSSLGSALYHLVKRKPDAGPSPQVAKMLTVRIALSVFLFLIVVVLVLSGVIRPEGIGARMNAIHNLENSRK